MTCRQEVQTARERIAKCQSNVAAQRTRLAELECEDSDTWLAKRLLAASEATLRAHREHLVMLGPMLPQGESGPD